MIRAARTAVALVVVLGGVSAAAFAQAPVAYHLTFPEREHRLMHVDVTFPDVPEGTLQVRMSRTSPGRYALHEFAKNVFDVRVTDPGGRALAVSRPNPHQWDVSGHSGTVRIRYRVFGDRVDGTYLGIDHTHAHINMPAALMWARGLELRPASVRFEPPAGTKWRVATQLFPGPDPFTFTAPNLQYLMDSPAEFSDFALRTFTVSDGGDRAQTVRIAVHHDGSDADLDAFARDVESIVREARHVFGEYPRFEGDTYTFIADLLPWANGDAMEHRNSAVVTSSSSIQSGRLLLLNSIAHEFVHAWNVERIRPQSLEPFDFEESMSSGELWFGEGFTSYYASLLLQRAGLTSVGDFAQDMGRTINLVLGSPGRALRTAEEMSRLAPFVDAAVAVDRTNFENTFLSYYTWGSAIALGLDVALRDRTSGRATLDHYMRAMWERHGRPGGRLPGHVDRPYTMQDLQTVLADVSADPVFAEQFFARYIRGHEVPDYEALLARAGFVLRRVAPGQGFMGALRMQDASGGVRITGPVPFGSPAYEAGLERDDVIVSLDGREVSRALDILRATQAARPGDQLAVVFQRRGQRVTSSLRLVENPRRELVPAEQAGGTLMDGQKQFREGWLASGARVAAF